MSSNGPGSGDRRDGHDTAGAPVGDDVTAAESVIAGSRDAGQARMVGVGEKAITARRAVARAVLHCRPETAEMLRTGTLPKGDAVATARVAAVMAAKKTPDIVPLCHPLPLTGAQLHVEVEHDRVLLKAVVETVSRTGVEMEALTAVTVAGLTIYDMAKAVDKWMTLTDIALVEKEGGRSGHWLRPDFGDTPGAGPSARVDGK